MSEEKNSKIKDTLRATKKRRSNMDCRVFSVKIQENKLSKAKLEKLRRCFLEGKWLHNAVLSSTDGFPRSGIKPFKLRLKTLLRKEKLSFCLLK